MNQNGPYDPSTVGNVTIQTFAPACYAIFINLSDYAISVKVQGTDSSTFTLAAHGNRVVRVSGQNMRVSWTSPTLTVANAGPIQQLFIDIADLQEYSPAELAAIVPSSAAIGAAAIVNMNSPIFTGPAEFQGLIDPENPATTINGTTGTVSIYYPIWGSALKLWVVYFVNYTSSGVPTFTFPSIMNECWLFVGNIGSASVSLYRSGSAISHRIVTGWGTPSAAGQDQPGTVLRGDTIAFSGGNSADSLVIGSVGSALNSVIWGIGI